MKFVNTSFIPNNKISLAIVDRRIPADMVNSLNKLNIHIIKSNICSNTYNAISCHPDISLIKINDNNIIVAPNVYNYYLDKLHSLGFNIIMGDSLIDKKYPNNIQYNVAIFGKYAVHNFTYTDKKVLNYIESNNFIKINVKQGYCKCSICIVDDNSIITSDKGIYNEVIKYNINCLLIENGHIDLFDLNYGFIGGCSGLISQDELAFFGDITHHPNFKEIKEFVEKRNKKIVCLSNSKLLDLGSLIPLI